VAVVIVVFVVIVMKNDDDGDEQYTLCFPLHARLNDVWWSVNALALARRVASIHMSGWHLKQNKGRNNSLPSSGIFPLFFFFLFFIYAFVGFKKKIN
jgi:hypothetical protein